MTNPKKRENQRGRYDEGLKRKIAKDYLSGKASYAILAQDCIFRIIWLFATFGESGLKI
jgi:hypothetical protein